MSLLAAALAFVLGIVLYVTEAVVNFWLLGGIFLGAWFVLWVLFRVFRGDALGEILDAFILFSIFSDD